MIPSPKGEGRGKASGQATRRHRQGLNSVMRPPTAARVHEAGQSSGVERKDAVAQRRKAKKFEAGQKMTHSGVTQRLRSHAPYFLAPCRLCVLAFRFKSLAMTQGGAPAGIDQNQPGDPS
jgi:hypothetical protein